MQGNGRISTVDGNGWNACLLREVLVSVSFLLGQTLRACLNFAQLYFECCFRGYFSGVLRNVAGYVTKYAGKRDRKEAQKKLNINIKEENLNRL